MATGYDVATARDRIRRVFQYLQEMHRVRTPPATHLDDREWALRLDTLPQSGYVRRGYSHTAELPVARADAALGEFILKVGRPSESDCPEPSVVFKNWLKPGWQRFGADPDEFLKKTLRVRGRLQSFEDSDERVDAFEEWLEQKRRWERGARQDVDALAVFSDLFDLYARFERESEKYQLYLADGILVMEHEEGRVEHPLLLQRVNLEFDPSLPEFTLVDSEDNPEIYTPLLRHIGLDGRAIQSMGEALAREHFHPLGGSATSEFLKDLVQRFWTHGQFFESELEIAGASGVYLYRQPHLFLGQRNQGLVENIEGYLQALPHATELPESLLRVVGIETGRAAEESEEPVDVLLTKHANAEQEAVIRRLAETGAVIVQGPPGTGKSHTIANLIGHLLAQHKSILVTSHASKALRVVREQLAPPLRPLCVSVLQNDEQSSRQLEESITGIVNYLATTSERKLAREIERLAEQRGKLRQEHGVLCEQLLEAVWSEYRELAVPGGSATPSEAARRVAELAETEAWIPGPLEDDAQLPLSDEEIAELYRINAQLADEDEKLLASELPDPNAFPSQKAFAELYDELGRLEKHRADAGRGLWLHDRQDAAALAELQSLANDAIEMLEDDEEWLRDCLAAGRDGEEQRRPWQELVALVEDCAREIGEKEPQTLDQGPAVRSDKPLAELLDAARAIVDHLESGKRLSKLVRLRKPDWNELIQAARVDEGAPSKLAHFRAIRAHLEVRLLRDRLVQRWDRQLAPAGAPEAKKLGRRPERKALETIESLRLALDWYPRVWAPVQAKLEELGLDWPQLVGGRAARGAKAPDVGAIRELVAERLGPAIEARTRGLRLQELEAQRTAWMLEVDAHARRDASRSLVRRFRSAIKKGDYDAYAEAHQRLSELVERRAELARRNALLERLEAAAPAWAEALRARRAPHDGCEPPGDVENAWRYRAFEQRLAAHSQVDPDRLQEKLGAVKEQLFALTAEYVEKLSWQAQLRRTGLKQQQALSGWLGLHKKIGKGTGKHVARLKEEAKKTLVECRNAVPVWIMPLSRVVESFDMASTRFDVVIMDEASQSDVLGLAAFALGREVVVVGDHEQVSPYAVGQRGDKIHSLIDELLVDIPNKQLYDGRTSVYDLARQSFGGTIRLVEHFRCVPDIIQFSNHLCYGGEIRALREASSSRLRPHLVAHRVADGHDSNGINKNEALEIVSLVSAVCRLPEYEGCTIGVICLVGTDQALYIDSVLRRRLTVAEYQRRRVLCGNASQFQGDERDVIFLSLVNSPNNGGPLPLRQRDDVKKVFNVAASRARDQLWVVHSLDPGRDLKPGDLRLALISHAENPGALRPEGQTGSKKFSSDLEKRVFADLSGAGYGINRNYRIGEHSIDLVVTDGRRRIGIQCDGDRSQSREALAEEMDRQLTLERLGWEFVRLRGSEFFRDPERTLAKLRARLAELEIRPCAPSPEVTTPEPEPLHAKVVKRAELIRARWRDIPSVTSVVTRAEQSDAASEARAALDDDADDEES